MTTPAQTNKTKSPPTPSYTLKDAFEDVKKLYGRFSHASFSQPEIASALKMSSTSGSFVRRIFSISEYGLVDRSGEKSSVSKLFHSLDPADPKRPDFQRAAMQAIRRSPVFTELLNDFKTKWPGEEVVGQRLEKERGFNAERAREVAKVLFKSLQFAGVLDANNNILPVREGDVEQTSIESSGGGGASGAQSQAEPEKVVLSGSNRRSEVPLADGRVAVVIYPHDLTSSEATKIGKVLGALVD
jgi:hypothetical protein